MLVGAMADKQSPAMLGDRKSPIGDRG